jgi:DNA polymerase
MSGRVLLVDIEAGAPQGLDVGSPAYCDAAVIWCVVAREAGGGIAEGAGREWTLAPAPAGERLAPGYERSPAAWLASLPSLPWVAHGAESYDAPVWAASAARWGVALEPAAGWVDTMPRARAAGYRAGLDAAAEMLGLVARKDAGGRAALLRLGRLRARSHGEHRGSQLAALAAVVDYCRQDVVVLEQVWRRLAPLSDAETEVYAAHLAIVRRGWCLDRELAGAVVAEQAWLTERLVSASSAPRTALRSRPQCLAMLRRHGLDLPDLRASTIEAALAGEHGEVDTSARAVLEARAAVARVGAGKAGAMLAWSSSDGRVRQSLVYHGAGPGRWSGRGAQPQNAARPVCGIVDPTDMWAQPDGDAPREPVHGWSVRWGHRLHHAPADIVQSLVRACVTAQPGHVLVSADWSQIEARILLWAVGDPALADYASGADPYVSMARVIWPGEWPADGDAAATRRRVGKAAVLGCGYGMGAARFAAHAGAALETAGVAAASVVGAWRRRHSRVCEWWRAMERAAVAVTLDPSVSVACGPVTWHAERRVGDRLDVAMVLPSGRPIWYPGAEVEGERQYEQRWSYRSPRGRRTVWGGVLVENAVQAMARDLLASALVGLESRSVCVVLHVHDEIVVECAAGRADVVSRHVRDAMTTSAPAWAAGLPLAVDLHVGERWEG